MLLRTRGRIQNPTIQARPMSREFRTVAQPPPVQSVESKNGTYPGLCITP
jgi:hypothetical protein